MALATEYESEVLPELEWESYPESSGEAEFQDALARMYRGGRQHVLNTTHSILRNGARLALVHGEKLGKIPIPHVPKDYTAGNRAAGQQLGWMVHDALMNLDGRIPERELEFEAELNPVRKWYPDAMLEHLGHLAAEAEGETGEAFIGAMIPIVARLFSSAAPAIARVAPQLTGAAVAAARKFAQNPDTRALIRLMPTIIRRSAQNIARQTAHGNQIHPKQAVRTVARETYRMLSSPQQATQAFRRSQCLDRRLHRVNSSVSGPRCHNCGAKVR